MKYLSILCLICIPGCTTFQEAQKDMKRDIDGFKVEFARVFLKKDIEKEID
jgi:hypothetical protein